MGINIRRALPLSTIVSIAHPLAEEFTLSLAFILAITRTESAFDPLALSPKGAVGLMQLMPATARDMGVTDRENPVDNMRGGVKYLHHIARTKLPAATMLQVAAAYNCGPEFVKAHPSAQDWPAETQDYVRRVAYHYVKFGKVRV